MKADPKRDPERLRGSGDAEIRALLAAPASLPPASLHREVRAAVEARLSQGGGPRRSRLRWGLIGGGVLLAGGALAFGLVRGYQQVPTRGPDAHAIAATPSIAAPVAPPIGEEPSAPAPAPAIRRGRPAPVPPPTGVPRAAREQPFGGPGLAWPPGGMVDPVDSSPGAAGKPTPSAARRLVIARQGRREITLAVTGDDHGFHINGQVRDARVDLEIAGPRITGKLGDENVLLLMRGTEAQGTIANHDVGFTLVTTPHGHLMRGSVPAHTTRVETTETTLAYYPGCDDPLALVAPGSYRGTCGGGKAEIILPPVWQQLPPLPRLILLSLLLPEPERGDDRPRNLFGPPDWP
jgi:hypothetical protein